VAGEHADVIRSSYAAMNRGEVEAALAALHPDAVWNESPELPGADRFQGREEIERFLRGFLEQWETFHQEVTSVIVERERALAMITLTAIGRESGAQVRARYAHLWTMREGLGVEVDAFYDVEKALRELRSA
jgi:ketosteroid isomerase-like protein